MMELLARSAAFIIGVSLVLLFLRSMLHLWSSIDRRATLSPSSPGMWSTSPLRTWHRTGGPMTVFKMPWLGLSPSTACR